MTILPVKKFGSKKNKGFTLIEVMIVVGLIAVLTAIAIPGMQKYMERGRRAEAVGALSSIQLDMERWRSENPAYPNADEFPGVAGSNANTASYTIEIGDSDETSYTLTATLNEGFTDEQCSEMTVTSTDGDIARSPEVCF